MSYMIEYNIQPRAFLKGLLNVIYDWKYNILPRAFLKGLQDIIYEKLLKYYKNIFPPLI